MELTLSKKMMNNSLSDQMNLHQMQLNYQMEEDRILLRVSFKTKTNDLHEIRGWLTRRLVKNLWPNIGQALETQVVLDQPLASHARAEIANMAFESSISEIKESGNFDVPYEAEIQAFPMGEVPILVKSAQFHLHAHTPTRIQFLGPGQSSFDITFTSSMLHGFCKLLQRAVEAADWGMELILPAATEVRPSTRMLN